jgi:hypothetical protein
MSDEVKVTVIGVPREQRMALKQACLLSETSISAELRRRLPLVIAQIEGRALGYNELVELLLAMMGIVNLALSGRDKQARAAREEISTDLRRFRHQVKGELRRPL